MLNTSEAGEGSVLVIAGSVCSHFQLQFEMETQVSAMKQNIGIFIHFNDKYQTEKA